MRHGGTGAGVLCGLGDDAAAIRLLPPILITTDVLVEGVHFRRGWGTPRQLGRKAFAVNASDIAAMGGRPTHALIDLRTPATIPVADLAALYQGFRGAAARHGVTLVGGNTSRAAQLSVGVTLLGQAPHGYVTRGSCRVGHDLYVTGVLGWASRGLRALERGRGTGAAVRRFLEPPSRVAIGQALARTRLLGGMIDVSDGCLQDLQHLCGTSRVGAVVEADCLPLAPGYRRASRRDLRMALTGGEDYELLFSAEPALGRRLTVLQRRFRCPVSRIGRIVPAREGIDVVNGGGRSLAIAGSGHDHFRSRARQR